MLRLRTAPHSQNISPPLDDPPGVPEAADSPDHSEPRPMQDALSVSASLPNTAEVKQLLQHVPAELRTAACQEDWQRLAKLIKMSEQNYCLFRGQWLARATYLSRHIQAQHKCLLVLQPRLLSWLEERHTAQSSPWAHCSVDFKATHTSCCKHAHSCATLYRTGLLKAVFCTQVCSDGGDPRLDGDPEEGAKELVSAEAELGPMRSMVPPGMMALKGVEPAEESEDAPMLRAALLQHCQPRSRWKPHTGTARRVSHRRNLGPHQVPSRARAKARARHPLALAGQVATRRTRRTKEQDDSWGDWWNNSGKPRRDNRRDNWRQDRSQGSDRKTERLTTPPESVCAPGRKKKRHAVMLCLKYLACSDCMRLVASAAGSCCRAN